MNEKDYAPIRLEGNGATKEFEYKWKTFEKTDLVIQIEDTEGNLTTLKLGRDYNVNVEAMGGNVILTTPPAEGEFINISRKISQYQSKGYSTSGGFQGSEIENSFDRVSCNLQDMNYNIETFKKDFSNEVNSTITANKDETDAKITNFENEINSKLQAVNEAADNINNFEAALDTAKELANEVILNANEASQSANMASKSANEALNAAEVAENIASSMLDVDLTKLSQNGRQVIDDRVSSILDEMSKINDSGELNTKISFDSKILTIQEGMSVKIPTGKNGDENQYSYLTTNKAIVCEYSTSAAGNVLAINEEGLLQEYTSYREAASPPSDLAPVIYLNTDENKMYKKINDETGFIETSEGLIAKDFNRNEDGTITSITQYSPNIIYLVPDTIHTADIKFPAYVFLPALQENNLYINTMLEFTLAPDITLTLPNNIKYSGGEAPELVADGITINRLIFDTTTGGADWICYFSSTGS